MLRNYDRSQTVWNDNNEYKHKIQEEMQRTINIKQACHHSIQNNYPLICYLYNKEWKAQNHDCLLVCMAEMTGRGNGGHYIKKNSQDLLYCYIYSIPISKLQWLWQ